MPLSIDTILAFYNTLLTNVLLIAIGTTKTDATKLVIVTYFNLTGLVCVTAYYTD